MKRVLLVGLCVAAWMAFAKEAAEKKPELTDAEKAAKRAERIEAAGGFVETGAKGPVIRVASCQARIPDAELEKAVADMKLFMKLHTSFAKAAPDVDARKAAAEKDTACFIQVVDVPGEPALVIIPEESRARVNVAPLMADVDAAKAAKRVRREIWRAFGYLFGAPADRMGAMMPVRSMKELDAIGTEQISPMAIMVTTAQCRKLGMEPPKRALYRKACKEGWAPAPTNDVQKALWKEFHK